jgi:hypothetical protein
MLFVVVVVLRYCLGFCGLVFWKAIYISILVYFHFTAPVSYLGITTSSAKKLPHRVVHLNKGEEEMVF